MGERKARILWMSRHQPLERQVAELERLFGATQLVVDGKPFDHFERIARRCEGFDHVVVVAPLSVIEQLVNAGVRPLKAVMSLCSATDAEVTMGSRHQPRYYRFERFVRITELKVVTEELW